MIQSNSPGIGNEEVLQAFQAFGRFCLLIWRWIRITVPSNWVIAIISGYLAFYTYRLEVQAVKPTEAASNSARAALISSEAALEANRIAKETSDKLLALNQRSIEEAESNARFNRNLLRARISVDSVRLIPPYQTGGMFRTNWFIFNNAESPALNMYSAFLADYEPIRAETLMRAPLFRTGEVAARSMHVIQGLGRRLNSQEANDVAFRPLYLAQILRYNDIFDDTTLVLSFWMHVPYDSDDRGPKTNGYFRGQDVIINRPYHEKRSQTHQTTQKVKTQEASKH